MSAPHSNKISIQQIDLDATKHRIHPRFVTGLYQNIRLVSMYFFLALFLLLPWLRYDGRQAIWFDVPSQHYYIFGMTFLTQDFYFIAAFALIAAFTLFMVTVYAGRVWCGYACPQTIWTHLYQHVEKWVIGDRNKRIKFDKSPMGPTKAFKRGLVYFIWLALSVITAATFVSYVAGTDQIYQSWQMIEHIPIPDWPTWIWVSMFIFTFATYANAGYMREQMCIQICPYGRFQSVMFDKDTLIVSYDYERGEPRGTRKKGTHPEDLGDCIECQMCVQVCPTGIDIRDGLQVGCIQCAACIDACNEVMDKVGYKRGLIRYTTERQLAEKENTRVFSKRLFAYLALLLVLCGGLIYALTDRVPLEIDIRRDRNQLSSLNTQGMIENSYVVKLTNKTQDEHTYKITLAPKDGLSLQLRFNDVPLDAGESFDMAVSIYGDPAIIDEGQTPVTLNVISEDGQYKVSKDNVFTTQGQ
ncbi:cytochrome c oxidase accessory protein CcoG [Psychrobacter sp. TAE2020]|uniref:cytochrome c oxidase accessory protein CcoG n=1 Tax=Psychrobacter sp. TAE2020 TaxID=2846762 RepID=UPI001C1249BA|nr:cytochrome c oxidase accessory protein CcoG [Psychrobacter sp. TAE2020]MBU5616325.1 cytochrome c oxidase accessory protein CcoG [Psychrobacter sp. TAE2020]